MTAFDVDSTYPPTKTKAHLQGIERSSRQLRLGLEQLAGPAVALLTPKDGSIAKIQRMVQELEYEARQARINLSSRRGPQPKTKARRIAYMAAVCYCEITGNKPTRVTYAPTESKEKALVSGVFVGFLKEVFGILGIIASADACAKEAIEAMDK